MADAALKEQLKSIISKATGGTVDSSAIGDYTPLMDLGIDSMAGVEIVMELETQFGVSITDPETGKEAFTSVQALADFVRANSEEKAVPGDVQSPGTHEKQKEDEKDLDSEQDSATKAGEPDDANDSIVDTEVDNLVGEYVKNTEQSEQLAQRIQSALMPQIESLVNQSVSSPLQNLTQQQTPQMLQEALLPVVTTSLKATLQDVLPDIVTKSVSQAITETMPTVIEESVKNSVSDTVSVSVRECIPQIIHETLPASVETTLRQSLPGMLRESLTLKDFFRLLLAKIRR